MNKEKGKRKRQYQSAFENEKEMIICQIFFVSYGLSNILRVGEHNYSLSLSTWLKYIGYSDLNSN